MNANPATAITALEARAIRRFEFDPDFHTRVQDRAAAMLGNQPDTPVHVRLQAAMRELQLKDESELADDAIERGARKLGSILDLDWDTAGVPSRESLKATVRAVLHAVKDDRP